MKSDGAKKRSLETNINKKWGNMERREQYCFPSPSFKYPIPVLLIDKSHDSAEAHDGQREFQT